MRRLVGLAALALPGLLFAQQAPGGAAPATRPRTVAEDLQLFSQVYNQIRVNHPDSLDSHRLFMSAIQAMVQATDPHSYVIPAARLQPGKAEELRQGRLHPVPIEWSFVGGSAVVAAVYAGTEASRRDILPGDELIAFDDQQMRAESALELELQLAGPRNSTVRLTLERRQADGSIARIERSVKRERFSEESAVPAALMLDDSTGYVRITTFVGEKVADDLSRAMGRLSDQGMKRFILDLRQNGGGSVDEAASIAGEFLPTGAVVYTSVSRRAAPDTGRVRRIVRSQRRQPMIVLIDGGSASASELVAGALQDHDRALIVGQPSFGKSLMMRGFPLSDGSILMLVVGHLQTPCGRVVQREYRGMTVRNYYRMAAAERDTVGRPGCSTAGGRRVFGGGGIYPDIRTAAAAPTPAWMRRIGELDITLAWVGGYVTANAASLTDLSQFASQQALAAGAEDEYRRFAEERGVAIPRSAEADAMLRRHLLGSVAFAKWGNPGVYEVEARMDPEVRNAIQYFSEMSARGIR
jgi:carboxyl-terminal processing protease